MAIASCPKCAAKLKVPDGTTASVRCPKCQTIFKSSAPAPAPAQPAFEVVDEPAPPPKSAAAARPAPAPPPPTAAENPFSNLGEKKKPASRDEDDDDDRPRKKRRDDDEDDDDRPKSKKRSRDDDDDDRPRGKKRSRDDDDDDDDRPRKKKRKHTRDDDDYGFDSSSRKNDGVQAGKLGAMILAFTFWFDVGMYGLLALLVLILWTGGDVSASLGLLIGPLRVLSWLLGLAGIGICLAGPPKARKLALTAAIFAGLHVLLFIIGILANAKISELDFRDRPARQAPPPGKTRSDEPALDSKDAGMLGLALGVGTSVLPAEFTLPTFVYGSKVFGKGFIGDVILFFLASACDIARLILVLLTLKAMADAARSYQAAGKLAIGVKSVAIVCGSFFFVTILVAVIIIEGELRSSARHVGSLTLLLLMLTHCLMMILPALGALQTAGDLKRRRG